MKCYKTITEQKTVLDYITCDLCGKKNNKYNDWSVNPYKTNKTRIHHEYGDNYPEGGGDMAIFSADICPDCFQNKLVPWLQEQGCKVDYKEIEL
jgi:hypothetical protein